MKTLEVEDRMKPLSVAAFVAVALVSSQAIPASAKDVSHQRQDIYLHQQAQPPLDNPKVGSVTIVTNPKGDVGKYVVYDNDGLPQSFGDVIQGDNLAKDINTLRDAYEWRPMEVSPTFEEDPVLSE